MNSGLGNDGILSPIDQEFCDCLFRHVRDILGMHSVPCLMRGAVLLQVPNRRVSLPEDVLASRKQFRRWHQVDLVHKEKRRHAQRLFFVESHWSSKHLKSKEPTIKSQKNLFFNGNRYIQ